MLDTVITSVGARTAVGLDAMQTGFLLRAGALGIREASLLDNEEERTTFCHTGMLPPHLLGVERLLALAVPALGEAIAPVAAALGKANVRILLCLDEWLGTENAGPPSDVERLVQALGRELTRRYELKSELEHSALGPASPGFAFGSSWEDLLQGRIAALVLGGIHSDYEPARARALSSVGRLYKSTETEGVLLGEAAAFAVFTLPRTAHHYGLPPRAKVLGFGKGFEKARPDNDESAFEASGLTLAVHQATGPLRRTGARIGWQMHDLTLERYRVHEWQAVMIRSQEALEGPQRVDAPCQRLGYLGAATMPLQSSLAVEAWRRGYAPAQRVLCLAGSDQGGRAALVLGAPTA